MKLERKRERERGVGREVSMRKYRGKQRWIDRERERK